MTTPICKDCLNVITKKEITCYRTIQTPKSDRWWIFKKFVPKYDYLQEEYKEEEELEWSGWKCQKDISINYVNGEPQYGFCLYKNKGGACEDFEPLEEI